MVQIDKWSSGYPGNLFFAQAINHGHVRTSNFDTAVSSQLLTFHVDCIDASNFTLQIPWP